MILQDERDYRNALDQLNSMKQNFVESGETDVKDLEIIRFLEEKVLDYERRNGLPISISKTPMILTVEEYNNARALVARWKARFGSTNDDADRKNLEQDIAMVEQHLQEYEERAKSRS